MRTLALEPLHGWAIAQRIQQISDDRLRVQQGSLYPALHRLEKQGHVKAEWKQSEKGQRAKYYSLTPAGRKRLAAEHARWKQMSAAIAGLMEPAQ